MSRIFLLITILIFGGLGGFISAIRSDDKKPVYWKDIVKGVGAAFLVPLFLALIRSDLGFDAYSETYDYLIIGGLCLVAAIFSDRFIDSIGDQIITKAREAAKEEVKPVEEKANALLFKASEKEKIQMTDSKVEPSESRESIYNDDNLSLLLTGVKSSINRDDIDRVLKALNETKYQFRTISGIAKDTSISRSTVLDILRELERVRVVGKVADGNRMLWYSM